MTDHKHRCSLFHSSDLVLVCPPFLSFGLTPCCYSISRMGFLSRPAAVRYSSIEHLYTERDQVSVGHSPSSDIPY